MKKTSFEIYLICLLAVWVLVGCAKTPAEGPSQQSPTSSPEATIVAILPSETSQPSATSLPSATSQPSATDEPAVTEPAAATATSFVWSEQDMMPGCTMMSLFPTPEPTKASLFAPVSKDDWVQGPETASVTIIEYSDFQ